MALSVSKLAPSTVVLAFVGYCVWPSVAELTSGSPPTKEQKRVPELGAALLSPKLAALPTKNPWGGKDADTLAAEKDAAKAAATSSAAGSLGAKTGGKRADLLADVKLDATCILGDRRLAVINGQVYAAQETVLAATPGGPPYKLVSVLPHKVLLECQGTVVELAYSNVVARPASSPRAGAGGKSTSAPRPADSMKPAVAATSQSTGIDNAVDKAGK